MCSKSGFVSTRMNSKNAEEEVVDELEVQDSLKMTPEAWSLHYRGREGSMSRTECTQEACQISLAESETLGSTLQRNLQLPGLLSECRGRSLQPKLGRQPPHGRHAHHDVDGLDHVFLNLPLTKRGSTFLRLRCIQFQHFDSLIVIRHPLFKFRVIRIVVSTKTRYISLQTISCVAAYLLSAWLLNREDILKDMSLIEPSIGGLGCHIE